MGRISSEKEGKRMEIFGRGRFNTNVGREEKQVLGNFIHPYFLQYINKDNLVMIDFQIF